MGKLLDYQRSAFPKRGTRPLTLAQSFVLKED
jgi:hypothetical protein